LRFHRNQQTVICFFLWRPGSGLAIEFTLRKIDLFSTFAAFMGFIKFIREDLFLRTAISAGADERFQVLVVFKTRAMLGCRHGILLAARHGGRAQTPAGHDSFIHTWSAVGLSDSRIFADGIAVRRVTAIVQKLTLFFA
jgi:hypothetical protein